MLKWTTYSAGQSGGREGQQPHTTRNNKVSRLSNQNFSYITTNLRIILKNLSNGN